MYPKVPAGVYTESSHACAGDVRTDRYRLRERLRFACSPGVLGDQHRGPKRFATESAPWQAGDVIAMFTDGITSKVDLSDELVLLHEHPIVIAEYLLDRFGRAGDDAMVLVAR